MILYELLLLILATLPSLVSAIDFEWSNTKAVNENLGLLAKGLMDYYEGSSPGGVVGMFHNPYYWWEAGAAWNSMLSYWYYTGDTQYNSIIKESLLAQVGEDWNYMPINQTTTEGNDDQAMWGVTVMAAAEYNFSNPSPDEPQWLYLAQAVFNTMADRWDSAHCGGGLRWQIFTWNNGYNYKNTVSNGCLFHLAARLARYTNNDTYIGWAEKVWDWLVDVNFITSKNGSYFIYDGAVMANNCSQVTQLEWTYNYGLFLSGCAYLYNHTNNTLWYDRLNGIWARTHVFFQKHDQVMYEGACQPSEKCNNDQRSFKGIFSRFLGLTMLLAPSFNQTIFEYLTPTTKAVMKSCSGGTDGHTCGLNWSNGSWDGYYGLGEQMSALELLLTRLIWTKGSMLSAATGASSTGNATSAGSSRNTVILNNDISVVGSDRAKAGVITAAFMIVFVAFTWWIMV